MGIGEFNLNSIVIWLFLMTGSWFKNYDLWIFFYYDRINVNINNGLNILVIN